MLTLFAVRTGLCGARRKVPPKKSDATCLSAFYASLERIVTRAPKFAYSFFRVLRSLNISMVPCANGRATPKCAGTGTRSAARCRKGGENVPGRAGFATCVLMSGGAEEDRTPDLRIANATLSQLSYRPIPIDCIESCRAMQAANIKGNALPKTWELRAILMRAVFKKHPQVIESIDGNSFGLL